MGRPESLGQFLHLTRREMLLVSAGLGMELALGSRRSVFAAETARPASLDAAGDTWSLDLAGDMWTLRDETQTQSLRAVVPGSTYTDLLRAGKIPDPFYGDNNAKVQWVAEKNWFYERAFEAPAELLAKRHVELVCHGLDTLATVWLNGQQVGRADNMFRAWTFDIKPYLRNGTNQLRIRFDTLAPFVEQQRKDYQQRFGVNLDNPRSWVRKGPYMWGWDWCQPVLTQPLGKGHRGEHRQFTDRFQSPALQHRKQRDGRRFVARCSCVLRFAPASHQSLRGTISPCCLHNPFTIACNTWPELNSAAEGNHERDCVHPLRTAGCPSVHRECKTCSRRQSSTGKSSGRIRQYTGPGYERSLAGPHHLRRASQTQKHVTRS